MAKNIKELNIGGSSYSYRPYGECDSSKLSPEKLVTCNDFKLFHGATILVKFTKSNGAGNISLNVNNTGSVPVKYFNAEQPISEIEWSENAIIEFYYDGESWIILSGNIPNVGKVSTTTHGNGLYYLCGSAWPVDRVSDTLRKNKNVYVNALSELYASGGFYESSDERLKTFIKPIDIDLDKLSKLRKNYFVFNSNNDKIELGVSAQEIQKLYPEIVNTDENGYLSVAYDKLSVIALAAIDELNRKNKELEERLSKIEKSLNI